MARWLGVTALVCAVLGGAASCGGRSHAQKPDGGSAGVRGAAGTGMSGSGTAGAGGHAGSTSETDGGTDAPAVLSCGKEKKACPAAGICVPANGCCDSTDCRAQDGKTGSCDTGTHVCSYSCGTGLKSCNGTCIPADGCCVDSDCANNLACTDSACKTSCSANSDCQSGFACSKGACLKVVKIVPGRDSTCALISDGMVRCWGGKFGAPGQIVAIAGIAGATDVAAGFEHACAIVGGGSVKCWGQNGLGQLGSGGSGDFALQPQTVSGISGATAIFAGGDRTCVILSEGALKCWGSGYLGDGNNPASSPSLPVSVGVLSGVSTVAVASRHICAITAGVVWCWGENRAGEIGLDPSMGPQNTFSAAPVSTGVHGTAVATGSSQLDSNSGYTCAVLSSGGVDCWGVRLDGTREFSPIPTLLPGSTGAIFVSGGIGYACLRASDSTVRCWGSNGRDELGIDAQDASSADSPSQPVTSLGAVTSLQTGVHHACATVPDGTARCWGENSTGQLGIGDQTPYVFIPVVLSSW